MGDLADTFITSFIDTQMALPDLGHFITTEFWDLVHQAEVDSGLASLKTGKMKQRLYPDDVFQNWTPTQNERYVTYLSTLRTAFEQILSHSSDLLTSHVKTYALHRFDFIFSGVIHGIHPILMTTGLITKFEEISVKYNECFREVC